MKIWQQIVTYLTEIDPSGSITATDTKSVVTLIVNISIGVGGGIATLLIIIGGIQMLGSGGDPGKVKEGQEMIVNALMGLALILLAVMVVRTLGFDVLRIPGFTM
ncbi:hypothetical protein JW962_03520 [Candidatus Dojkabacteria bacterium]|nr:hypothetical protein [Candidatus Dojkabacteria bacterium]